MKTDASTFMQRALLEAEAAGADRKNLGMRCHVGQFACAVAGRGDRLASVDKHRTDRNFFPRACRLRFQKRALHISWRVDRHLASRSPSC